MIVRTLRFGSKLNRMWSKCLTNNVRRDFILSMSGLIAIAIEYARSEFQLFAVNLGLKFSVLQLLAIANADIGSLNTKISTYIP